MSDVLDCVVTRFQWYLLELDCLGDGVQDLCDAVDSSPAGVLITDAEMRQAVAAIDQTLAAHIVAIRLDATVTDDRDLDFHDFGEQPAAEVLIRVVDGSSAFVMSKDKAIRKRLKAAHPRSVELSLEDVLG